MNSKLLDFKKIVNKVSSDNKNLNRKLEIKGNENVNLPPRVMYNRRNGTPVFYFLSIFSYFFNS